MDSTRRTFLGAGGTALGSMIHRPRTSHLRILSYSPMETASSKPSGCGRHATFTAGLRRIGASILAFCPASESVWSPVGAAFFLQRSKCRYTTVVPAKELFCTAPPTVLLSPADFVDPLAGAFDLAFRIQEAQPEGPPLWPPFGKDVGDAACAGMHADTFHTAHGAEDRVWVEAPMILVKEQHLRAGGDEEAIVRGR